MICLKKIINRLNRVSLKITGAVFSRELQGRSRTAAYTNITRSLRKRRRGNFSRYLKTTKENYTLKELIGQVE